jgi:DNA repair exonuclease SbcCD ATPase subunit
MDMLEEYAELQKRKNDLARQIKQICIKKKELLDARSELEAFVSQAHTEHTETLASINKMARKFGFPPRSADNKLDYMMHALTLPEPIKAMFADESMATILKLLTREAVLMHYEIFIADGEVNKCGRFDNEDLQESISSDPDFCPEEQQLYREAGMYIATFDGLLDKCSTMKTELDVLLPRKPELEKECKMLKQRIKTLEPIVEEYKACFQKYSNNEVYSVAQKQAQFLIRTLNKNKDEKLRQIDYDWDCFASEHESLDKKLRIQFNERYASLCSAYVLLHNFVSENSDYKEILSAKKSLLKACKNNNPEKEVGLFRKKVNEAVNENGCSLGKCDAPAALNAVLSLDEITIMHLHRKSQLDLQIYDLREKRDSLRSLCTYY